MAKRNLYKNNRNSYRPNSLNDRKTTKYNTDELFNNDETLNLEEKYIEGGNINQWANDSVLMDLNQLKELDKYLTNIPKNAYK